MSMTGLPVFDETVHVSNTWLHEITSRMGWDDRQKGYRLLRASLHALRDRLSPTSAAKLSAQLPMLLRGLYFEGWRPSETPQKTRTMETFLEPVRSAFANDPDFDAEAGFAEIISVMKLHVSAGEMEEIRLAMPETIKTLWDAP